MAPVVRCEGIAGDVLVVRLRDVAAVRRKGAELWFYMNTGEWLSVSVRDEDDAVALVAETSRLMVGIRGE
jgi:hypothetical protein